MSGKRRSEEIEREAEGIISMMTTLPTPDDSPSVKEQKVLQYRTWTKEAGRRVETNDELMQRVLEMMRERMGVNENNPSADVNAINLMEAGMADIGLSNGAAAELDKAGVPRNGACNYLLDEFIKAWREYGAELVVVQNNSTEDLCVGMRDALRINVWVDGEAHMPFVSEQDPENFIRVRRRMGE